MVATHEGLVEKASARSVRGVLFTRARYVAHRYGAHFHDAYSIGLVTKGALAFEQSRRSHSVSRGELSVINPGDTHTGQAGVEQGWTSYNILISSSDLSALLDDSGVELANVAFNGPVISSPGIAQLFHKAHSASILQASLLAQESCLIEALSSLIAHHGAKPGFTARASHRAGIQRAQAMIHDSFEQSSSLDELASVANLSKHHFLRVFREETGITPHAYLIQIRLQKAARLLADGHSIADAAFASGFADQSHFTKFFKRVWGLTPRSYASAL